MFEIREGGEFNGVSSSWSSFVRPPPVVWSAAFVRSSSWLRRSYADRLADVAMLCRNPYVNEAGLVFGCGQCQPCLINRRRIWTHRIMIETALHGDNAFVTLTYDEAHLPGDGSLVPSDVTLWLKRLRKAIEPRRIRYYAVGEYGDESWRPHYHAALFGYPRCLFGISRYGERRKNCCYACDEVRETWGKGNVHVGGLDREAAQYVAGYVTKKMTRKDDVRLGGRSPEFARMSLRPGIGGNAVSDIAEVLLRYGVVDIDVPNALRHGTKEWPLGRYIMRRLRTAVGRDEKVPQAVVDKIAADLFDVRMAARASESNPSVKAQVIAAGQARYNSLVAREKIFKQRKEKL